MSNIWERYIYLFIYIFIHSFIHRVLQIFFWYSIHLVFKNYMFARLSSWAPTGRATNRLKVRLNIIWYTFFGKYCRSTNWIRIWSISDTYTISLLFLQSQIRLTFWVSIKVIFTTSWGDNLKIETLETHGRSVFHHLESSLTGGGAY